MDRAWSSHLALVAVLLVATSWTASAGSVLEPATSPLQVPGQLLQVGEASVGKSTPPRSNSTGGDGRRMTMGPARSIGSFIQDLFDSVMDEPNENHAETLEACCKVFFWKLPERPGTSSVVARAVLVAQCVIVADTIAAPYNAYQDVKRAYSQMQWKGANISQKVDHVISIPAAMAKSLVSVPLRMMVNLGQLVTAVVFSLVSIQNGGRLL